MTNDELKAFMSMTPEDLVHHGIKGQKWGVRRFQDKSGKRTSAGKARAKYIRERKLSDEEKLKRDNWKTGSGFLTSRIDQDLQERSFRYRNGTEFTTTAAKTMKDFLNDTGDVPPDFKTKDPFTSFEEADISRINPGFGEPGTTQNCTKSAVAVEMLRYGVNVTAGRQAFPSSSDAYSYWYDGARPDRAFGVDKIEKTLLDYGDGASGAIGGFYKAGGGHEMHFSVTNGQVHIQDGQNGRKFGSLKEAVDAYGLEPTYRFDAYRLDDKKPNWDHMAEDSVIGPPPWQKKGWALKEDIDRTYTGYDVSQDWGRQYARNKYGSYQ